MGKKNIIEIEIESEILAYYSKQENPLAYITYVLEEHANYKKRKDEGEIQSDPALENYLIEKSENSSGNNNLNQKPAYENKDNKKHNPAVSLSSIAKKDENLFYRLRELGIKNLNRFEWITKREFENFKGFTSSQKKLILSELGVFNIVLGAARLRSKSLFQFPALSKSKSLDYYENYFSLLLNKLYGDGWLGRENEAPIELDSRPDRNLIKVWLILNFLIKEIDFDEFWKRTEDAARLLIIDERYRKRNLINCPATLNSNQFAAEIANKFDKVYRKNWLSWSGNKLAEDCGLEVRTWVAILNDLEIVRYYCVENNLINPQRRFAKFLKEIRNFSHYNAELS